MEEIQEIWKEVAGFENYLISNCGRVKSKERLVRYVHAVTGNEHFRLSKEKYLKLCFNIHNYKTVGLCKDNKSHTKTVHRLVACAFIDGGSEELVVNHIDGNKHNNRVDNLEWCTNKYNHEHAVKTGLCAKGESIKSSKLNDNAVFAIKYFLNKGYTHSELAIAFNISRTAITHISNGKSWRHIILALTQQPLKITLP